MYDEIKARLALLVGVPQDSMEYRHIEDPAAPYLTWYIENETITPDDSGRVYTRSCDCVLELHTISKDVELEREIELLFAEYTLEKHEDYDYAEDVYVITYNFTAMKKGRFKHGS